MSAKTAGGRSEVSNMFLVEGVLSELHVEVGTQNLLKEIDAHYRGKAVLTGAGAAVGDLFGQAASAASLAMYDGEDTQNFACLIDGRVMCGQFGGAEWLKVGNRVKAVVSKREAALYSHAVMDEQQGLLLVGHAWGARAEAVANRKIAGWSFAFGMLCVAITALFIPTGSWSYWELVGYAALGLGVICLAMTFWTTATMGRLSSPSTEVFRLLGFADPDRVNLNNYQIALVTSRDFRRALNEHGRAERPAGYDMAEYRRRNVFCYQRAIQDGKLALDQKG
jgi:hypothetical protein